MAVYKDKKTKPWFVKRSWYDAQKSDTILLVEDLKLSEKLKKLTSNWRHR